MLLHTSQHQIIHHFFFFPNFSQFPEFLTEKSTYLNKHGMYSVTSDLWPNKGMRKHRPLAIPQFSKQTNSREEIVIQTDIYTFYC